MEHYDQVLDLWTGTEGVMLTDSDTPEKAPGYLQRNPGMSQVALLTGQVVGAALCGHDGRRGYLHHLAVAMEHRGQGIGREIVAACLAKLQQHGITACNLFIIDGHAEARQFWSENGFAEWPQLRIMTRGLIDRSPRSPTERTD